MADYNETYLLKNLMARQQMRTTHIHDNMTLVSYWHEQYYVSESQIARTKTVIKAFLRVFPLRPTWVRSEPV